MPKQKLTLEDLQGLIKAIEKHADPLPVSLPTNWGTYLLVHAWFYLVRLEEEWAGRQRPRQKKAQALDDQILLFWEQAGRPLSWTLHPSAAVRALRKVASGHPLFDITDRALERAWKRAYERYTTSANFSQIFEKPPTRH